MIAFSLAGRTLWKCTPAILLNLGNVTVTIVWLINLGMTDWMRRFARVMPWPYAVVTRRRAAEPQAWTLIGAHSLSCSRKARPPPFRDYPKSALIRGVSSVFSLHVSSFFQRSLL